MRSWLAIGIGLVVNLLLAAPAAAQGGGGLYEPFPEPAPPGQVRAFMSKLPGDDAAAAAELTPDELDRGVFAADGLTAPAGAREASRRAGVEGGASFLEGWPIVLALLVVAGAAVVLRGRRSA